MNNTIIIITITVTNINYSVLIFIVIIIIILIHLSSSSSSSLCLLQICNLHISVHFNLLARQEQSGSLQVVRRPSLKSASEITFVNMFG